MVREAQAGLGLEDQDRDGAQDPEHGPLVVWAKEQESHALENGTALGRGERVSTVDTVYTCRTMNNTCTLQRRQAPGGAVRRPAHAGLQGQSAVLQAAATHLREGLGRAAPPHILAQPPN